LFSTDDETDLLLGANKGVSKGVAAIDSYSMPSYHLYNNDPLLISQFPRFNDHAIFLHYVNHFISL